METSRAYASLSGNLERDDIAAAQLAIDGEIEHRQVARPIVYLEFGADRPDMLRSQRWLLADQEAGVGIWAGDAVAFFRGHLT